MALVFIREMLALAKPKLRVRSWSLLGEVTRAALPGPARGRSPARAEAPQPARQGPRASEVSPGRGGRRGPVAPSLVGMGWPLHPRGAGL